MFDIRKIQENIIYEAVRAESNEDIANEVVYGKDNMSKAENNSDWVKSSMIRLENNFETETIEAGLFCKDGELFLQFDFCPCPMLSEVDKLETNTWCQCTTGYSKVLFEKAFNCDIDVELLKSIKMGDDICLMKIILHNPVWQ